MSTERITFCDGCGLYLEYELSMKIRMNEPCLIKQTKEVTFDFHNWGCIAEWCRKEGRRSRFNPNG